MGWVFDERYKVYSNDFGDFFFRIRKNPQKNKYIIFEYESFGVEVEFDSLEELFVFNIEKYVEDLRIKKREYHLNFMKGKYSSKPSKTKRYYIYEIDSGLFLGRATDRGWFLSEEPLQTFTMSQAHALKGEFYGLYLFDWLLIEA